MRTTEKKRMHLLRAVSPAAAYGELAAELRSRGERLGWLDWRPEERAAPEPAPRDEAAELGEAADLGVLRAVSVRRGRSVAVKPMTGPPVLRDIVREHFRGCLAVLVASGEESDSTPRIAAADDGFVVRLDERSWTLTAQELCDRLRRPRPFSPSYP